jgi:hypothetical protein
MNTRMIPVAIPRGLAAISAALPALFVPNAKPGFERACLAGASLAIVTAAIPWTPTPLTATIGMSLSLSLVAAWSTNLYTIPVDLYGAGRAAFGVSALVFSYGVMQALVSKPLGLGIERYGFAPVCLALAVLPLAGTLLVYWQVREERGESTRRGPTNRLQAQPPDAG